MINSDYKFIMGKWYLVIEGKGIYKRLPPSATNVVVSHLLHLEKREKREVEECPEV